MRIYDKILSAFLGLGLAIGMAGYVSLSLSQKTLIETVGTQSVELANTALNHVNDSIQQRLEDLQCRSLRLGEHSILMESNAIFDQEEDVNDLIVPMEDAWNGKSLNDRISLLMQNDLSKILRRDIECPNFYAEKYGCATLGEVFVTNKYGANAALTSKTSDFFQGDEPWWQHAKDYGTYVGPIQYDESTKLYAVDLAIRLNNQSGEFSGILKAVHNIHQFASILQSVKHSSMYDSTRLRLISHDQIIFDTNSKFTTPPPLEPRVRQNLVATETGYGHFELSKPKTLVAFSSSYSSDRPDALDTYLLLQFDLPEILTPIAQIKARFILVIALLIVVSTIIGQLLAQSMSNALMALKRMTFSFGCGNFDAQSQIKATGEIGELADALNRMARDLNHTQNNPGSQIETHEDAKKQPGSNNEILEQTV